MARSFIVLGAIFSFLAVALGAFGAHGLQDVLSADMLDTYETAVQYQMMHALGLILIGILIHVLQPTVMMQWAGWAMLVGIIIFSGSLYVLSMTGMKWLGMITPVGGVAFLIGWIFLIGSVIRQPS